MGVSEEVGVFDQSRACRIEWTDSERCHQVREFFIKHAGQSWSFTDCLCFVVMSSRGIRDALTKDRHFKQAGYGVLLQ